MSVPTHEPLAAADAERGLGAADLHRQLLSAVEVAIVATDLAGQVVFWNPFATRLYGWTAEEMLGAPLGALLVKEGTLPVDAIWAELRAGRRWRGEFVGVHRDGRTFPGYVSSSPLQAADGRTVGIVGMSVDLSDVKARESEISLLNAELEARVARQTHLLRESEGRLRTVAEALPVGVYLASADGTCLYANRAYTEVTGRGPGEPALGWRSGGAPRASRAACYSWLLACDPRDGDERWVSGRTVALRRSDDLDEYVGVVEDVTERHRAQEALRESEERYRTVFQECGDAIFVIDARGRIVEANPAAGELLGVAPGALAGRRALEAVEREAEQAFLAETLAVRPAVRDVPLRLRRLDGGRRDVLANVSVRRGPDGTGTGFLAVARDLTARNEAARAVGELSARLLAVQDDERRRVARELHDSTGQALTALGIDLALALRRLRSRDPGLRALLEESVRLVERCTQEVRTTSYLLHPPLLDEVGLPAALRWLCDGLPERSGLRVRLSLPADLRRLAPAQETALFRIVQEGLGNVVRHAGASEARVRMVVEDGVAHLHVEDDGRGMPPDVMEQLNTGGTPVGVGIAGMRERVRQLGGTLSIRSGAWGTEVWASIPVGEGGS